MKTNKLKQKWKKEILQWFSLSPKRNSAYTHCNSVGNIGFTMFSLWFTTLFSIQLLRACVRWPIEELFFIVFPQCHWVQLKKFLLNRATKSKQVKGKQWETDYNGYFPMKILTRRFGQLVKVIHLALINLDVAQQLVN